MKIANIEREVLHTSERLEEFQSNCQERCDMIILKITKKKQV